jgi:hypothetical protein
VSSTNKRPSFEQQRQQKSTNLYNVIWFSWSTKSDTLCTNLLLGHTQPRVFTNSSVVWAISLASRPRVFNPRPVATTGNYVHAIKITQWFRRSGITLLFFNSRPARQFAITSVAPFIERLHAHVLGQACQTEGPPRATWVTFVLSWGSHTITNWSNLIKIIAKYFYYLNLETYSVHTNGLAASHIHECEVIK